MTKKKVGSLDRSRALFPKRILVSGNLKHVFSTKVSNYAHVRAMKGKINTVLRILLIRVYSVINMKKLPKKRNRN